MPVQQPPKPPYPPYGSYTNTAKPAKNPKRRRLIIILCVVAALIIAGGVITGVYFYLNRNFRVTPDTVTIESDGGTVYYEVQGPDDWRILSSPKEWSYISRDGNRLVWGASENESRERGDTIYIGNDRKRCRVILLQKSGAFYASPSNQIANASGGSKTYYIYGQDDWIIADGPQGWGKVTRDGNTLTWRVNENHAGSRNDAVLLKAGKKELIVTIMQEGALTAEKMSLTSGYSENTKRIEISGPTEWDCSSSEYWMDVSREGNKLRVDFSENDDSEAREGYITVSGGGQSIRIEVKQNKKSSGSYYPVNYGWGWGW